MNIKIPNEKVVAVLKNGEPIKAISARALRAANPEVFTSFAGRDGYDFGAIGLGLFAPDGKSVSGMLVVDEVKKAFADLPDGFIMPINTSHHRSGCVRNVSDLAGVACEMTWIREYMGEIVELLRKNLGEPKIA